jgi:DNA invertase Pin-like site-specific DNA recombinase
MKAALYARVSTIDKDQNPEVQLVQLREFCQRMGWEIFHEYTDKASAVDYVHRVAWTDMMRAAAARRFDYLLVWDLTRAFRSSIHALNSLEMLQKYGVNFVCINHSDIRTDTPTGKAIFTILAAFAEMEREGIKERSQAGMDYAKKHGTKSGLPIGRPRAPFDFAKVCNALRLGKKSYTEASRILSEDSKNPVTAGFVFNRVKREAEARGISHEDLLKEIMRD